MAFDVARVRGLIPAVGDGWVHMDATAGMQVPDQVVAAMAAAGRAPQSVPGGVFPASGMASELEYEARSAVADLVGGDPRGVVLGPNRAVLLERLAEAVGSTWILGDEVVVTRLDDMANVTPWVRAAQRRGAAVQRAEIDLESGELPVWQFDELLDATTRVVALTAASGELGTCVDVAAVAERAQTIGALLVVDLATAAAFAPLDLDTLGADVVALDAAAWGGPQVGALVFRVPALLDRLPSCSLDPAARGPQRLELGAHPYPALAGLTASIEHLAGLDDGIAGTRRGRLLGSMAALEAYHTGLLDELVADLLDIDVTVLGWSERRVPRLSLTLQAKAPDVVEHLAERGICAFADPGNQGVLASLGAAEAGGAVRIGLAHYTTRAETGA
ncbi:MAG TPA: aminotransferase class V-fold PLP-dependent enzyme, partial [Pseudonocardia sp.]|nr:aminotransferase class V-fold PLP-dependent enzyme [Pseudonocardia sp.]